MVQGWRCVNVTLINPNDCVSLGQMVEKLREHLNKYLPQLGKKKSEALVVNYVAKMVCVLLSPWKSFSQHGQSSTTGYGGDQFTLDSFTI